MPARIVVASSAFRPARVELHADAGVEAAREIDGVTQRVHESDVDPERVRVLDREVDAAGARFVEHGRERGLERVRGLFPRERSKRAGREDDRGCTDRDRRLDRTDQPFAVDDPSGADRRGGTGRGR